MPVHADSGAAGDAAGSPGLISGNTVQLPVHIPVNLCGNTVNVVGLLNPAMGNRCANEDEKGGADSAGGGAVTSGGAVAEGGAKDSPGVLSGNGVQLPVHLPVNACGNRVSVVGLLNPAMGNRCGNESTNGPDRPDRPDVPVKPTPTPSAPPHANPAPGPAPYTPPQHIASLARTGADATVPAALGSAALVLVGAVVYRRFRPSAVR